MYGEDLGSCANAPDAYSNKPVWVRMLVVLAGPFTNFLLAFILFWTVSMMGVSHIKPVVGQVLQNSYAETAKLKPGDQIVRVQNEDTHDWQQVMIVLLAAIGNSQPVDIWVLPKQGRSLVKKMLDLRTWRIDKRDPMIFESLGLLPYMPPVVPRIARVVPESPAARAGLRANDLIRTVNAKPISEWSQVAEAIVKSPNQMMTLSVVRAGHPRELSVPLSSQKRDGVVMGYLGVMVHPPAFPSSMIYVERYNPWTALKPAWQKTWLFFEYNAIVLAKMVTAKLSMKTMGGPISIFQAAGQSTEGGWAVYLSFIAFISLTVGFINLLPIPGLDGGHFLFQVLETLFRRPVPIKIQQYGLTFGLLFVLLLIVHATINDLLRIFG